MNIHLLQWHIYDVYPKFSQHKKIWKANGGSKFSQCAEISWIKIRMCLEVCQLLPPICYKKACRSKRNQLTHQRSFEPGPGDEATSQSCFESMGKKNMKKTNSLGLKYPKVVASFYIQKKIILKKPSLIKKKKTVTEISTPMKTANSSLGHHHPDELASCDAKIDTFQWTITKG